ncbi:MAG: hypothetical protein ACFE9Z_11810 [Promethearchaeota archaeon]
MEPLKTISSIEIPTNKMFYDKKTNVFSAEILDFMFVGTYKKSTRISKVLDDIFSSFKEIQINRNDIYFIDFVTNARMAEDKKLKDLKLSKKKKVEKKKEKKEEKPEEKITLKDTIEKQALKLKEEDYELEESYDEDSELLYGGDDFKFKEEVVEEEKQLKRDVRESERSRREAPKAKKKESREFPSPAPSRVAPPPPPAAGAPSRHDSTTSAPPPPPGGPPSDVLAGLGAPPPKSEFEPSIVAPEEPQPTIYEINMGLQYYSVMMEQRSYLFYVYFSHKELKIVDEEGKTIYETTFQIVTTKKEPPVLDLKIEGDGFEVHPIFGKVEVKKDAVNPPVMIFSIMPIKSKKDKKKKKESERRYLNVYIEFEEKVISHTILSIIVQPKYFKLKIGPIQLNLSKKAAAIISFISILIAGISLIWTLFSWDPTSSFIDILSGFAPGLGSIVFVAIFLITLFKEGIYPLKEKISAFLNFDQEGILIK